MKNNNHRKILICSFILCFAFLFLNTNNVLAIDAKRNISQNGLTVLHSEKHSLPIVMVTLLVRGGQINEPEELAGLANLTAELLTEGTKSRKSADISEEVEFIGASLDASAGSDYITITLSVLKKDINKGFELFSDVLLNPTFPQDEIDRKKDLIKGSLKQREEEPSYLAERAFKKEVFGEYPYGRIIEGSVETIDNIKRDYLVKFYHDNFLPNNSILSVVGDLTSDELNTLIEKYLGEWKQTDLPLKIVKEFDGVNMKSIVKIERDLTQANIVIGNLGIRRENPDYYAVSVMNYILGGGGFSSRLMQSIRDEMGLAYDVNSAFAAYKEQGSFQIDVQTKNESASTVINEILEQIKRIRNEEVSDDELSEAKSYLTGSFPRRLDTNRKISNFLAAVEFYNLGLDYAEKYPDYINSVTKEDVLKVARKYLDPEKYVLVIVANQKKADIQGLDSQ
ncbi:MAG: hypothetical protein A2Y97_05530 [Nitrospirae bacterium RBG_13_39_12]|nr:MAG: hypothetical protein A2Y97_05530 [Nitrospirae bacterium RBG_13_39_12]